LNKVTEPIRDSFVWQVRVYWEDTDAGGVVYHSRYLNFFERARTEWLRAHGVHQSRLVQEDGVVFAIRRMEIDWRLPARLDDELEVTVESVEAGRSRMTFRQEMVRSTDGSCLASAVVVAACLGADSFKPARMPEWIRSEIENVE
jgi:acyl-CoA thioester hydrolase